MTSNMMIWNAANRPPQSALKTIGGGRLKGFTDINPQWRMQAMTELFGPCGIGWKYSVDKIGLEPLGKDGEVAAYAIVSIWYKNPMLEGDSWADPIQGVGGSMAVAKESSGLKVSDECYKMAITDALGVAMKALGIGADIYMGRWDGSKYKDPESLKQDTLKITKETKDDVYRQSIEAIAASDEVGLKQVWSEFDTDEKAVLWGLFNSQQRKAMKLLMEIK